MNKIVHDGKKHKLYKGQKIGRLTVLSFSHRDEASKAHILCKCDCGIEKTFEATSLCRRTRSCGCLSAEMSSKRVRTHGLTRTRIYVIWQNMMYRCYKENSTSYKNYGAKGIDVCEEWHIFENFYKDMFKGYSDKLTLDRIDNNKGYSKENCRWSSYSKQNRNRKNNHIVIFKGRQMCLADAVDISGLNYTTVERRINQHGWDAEKALTTPVRKKL